MKSDPAESRHERRFVRPIALWSAGPCLALAIFSCSTAAPGPASASQAEPVPKPEAVAGDWMFETRIGDQPVEGRLHFSITGGVLAGSVYDADANGREMKNIELKGSKISWDAGNQHYEGTAGAVAMKGTVRRLARRESGDDDSAGMPSGRVGGGGYAGGRFGGGGRRGRGRRTESTANITWSAYKPGAPSPTPAATPPPQR